MICDPCKQGGAGNRALNAVPLPPPAVTKYYLKWIGEWHAKCGNPKTCTCQHAVGYVLNVRSDG